MWRCDALPTRALSAEFAQRVALTVGCAAYVQVTCEGEYVATVYKVQEMQDLRLSLAAAAAVVLHRLRPQAAPPPPPPQQPADAVVPPPQPSARVEEPAVGGSRVGKRSRQPSYKTREPSGHMSGDSKRTRT